MVIYQVGDDIVSKVVKNEEVVHFTMQLAYANSFKPVDVPGLHFYPKRV
jgi:hypothetical protein